MSFLVPFSKYPFSLLVQFHQSIVAFFPEFYSMHINCGGKEVIVDGNTKYEDDTDSGGPSKFYQSRTNWAFSSTGHFMDNDRPMDSFIGTNMSRFTMENSGLYTTARLSALSLTFYGFCLENGNYSVKLHFAKITFTDDKTYSSLGRRLFDVYVQVMNHITSMFTNQSSNFKKY